MKETLAELEQWGADVIFGRAKGFRAGMTRLLMTFLAAIFRQLVQLRLLVFRKRWKQQAHLGTDIGMQRTPGKITEGQPVGLEANISHYRKGLG